VPVSTSGSQWPGRSRGPAEAGHYVPGVRLKAEATYGGPAEAGRYVRGSGWSRTLRTRVRL